MFPYTEKYNESDKRSQNNNLEYKIHPKCKNAFKQNQFVRTIVNKNEKKYLKLSNTSKSYFVIYINSLIHILYVLYFWYIWYILYFLYLYIYIYTRTCVGP